MLPGKQYKPADFLNMAWRQRWVICVPIVLGFYAALIVSSRVGDVYQSEMLIQVVPQRVPDTYVRSTVTMKTEDRLNTLNQQVRSRTELEPLIEQLNLYPEERKRLPMQDVVQRMRDSITLEPARSQQSSKETDAFYVRFSYPNKQLATRVTDRIGMMFIDVNARDRGNTAEATDEFLQAQLTSARQKLEEQERRLQQFREKNQGKLPTQTSFNMQAMQDVRLELMALNESLAHDRDSKMVIERVLASGEETAPTETPKDAVPPVVSPSDPSAAAAGTVQQQLAGLRDQLTRQSLTKRPEHPDIVRLKRNIADLEQRAAAQVAETKPAAATAAAPLSPEKAARMTLATERRADIDRLQSQIDYKEQKERDLHKTLDDYARRMEQTPGVESEWIALSRDYDTQNTAYKTLLAKSEESQMATALEKRQIGEQFRVLDPARPPERPIGMPRMEINAIGAVAGFVLGLLLAAGRELLDSSFRNAREILDVLSLPVVATLPYIVSAADRQRVRRQRQAVSAAIAVLVAAGGYGFWAMQLWKHIR